MGGFPVLFSLFVQWGILGDSRGRDTARAQRSLKSREGSSTQRAAGKEGERKEGKSASSAAAKGTLFRLDVETRLGEYSKEKG